MKKEKKLSLELFSEKSEKSEKSDRDNGGFSYPLYLSSSALTPSAVYHNITGQHRDRAERWADELSSGTHKDIATRGVSAFNYVAHHRLEAVLAVWVLMLLVGGSILLWSRQENETNLTHASLLKLVGTGLAVKVMALIVIAAWDKLRGPKRPDYAVFKNFISHIARMEFTTKADQDKQRVITHPDLDNPNEREAFISWHMEFISWLARSENQPKGDAPDLEGNWKAIGSIVQHIREWFQSELLPTEHSVNSSPTLDRGFSLNINKTESLLSQKPSKNRRKSLQRSTKIKPSDDFHVGDDLYETPLAHHFLAASLEEKKIAAESNWREIQLIEQKKAENPSDVPMQILSHTVGLYLNRENPNAVKILHGFLKGVLSHPFRTDSLNRHYNFWMGIKAQSFQLINMLRPAIANGQWRNWRYFYAQDETVTEAFKCLSSEEQAWMIFTLMAGSDHGKLLALSILQDTRLSLKSLAEFFTTYLQEFGDISEPDAKEVCKRGGNQSPSEQDIEEFRQDVRDQMRWQLLWLTENSAGRITALFDQNASVATQILLSFTYDLPYKDSAKSNRYAVLPEKPLMNQWQMQIDEHHKTKTYWTETANWQGQFGIVTPDLSLTRQQVVEVLLNVVKNNKLLIGMDSNEDTWNCSSCDYLAEEIVEWLLREEIRDTVPKIFLEGVRLADKKDQNQLFNYCKRLEVIKNYLNYGVRLNLPLGHRAMVLFMEFSGYEVYTYSVLNDNNMKHEDWISKASAPVCHILLGNNGFEWSLLRTKQKIQEIGKSEDHDKPHPMNLHAQKLYWSVSDHEQQQTITERMEYGHPTHNTKGFEGSTAPLFSLETPENIAAMREGILQAGSLKTLGPKLLAHNPQITTFKQLAILLSDPMHGADHQRAFQELLDKYYDEGKREKIRNVASGFIQWLNHDNTLQDFEKDRVRARFTAALLLEEDPTCKVIRPDERASNFYHIVKISYPKHNLLEVFHLIYFAFAEKYSVIPMQGLSDFCPTEKRRLYVEKVNRDEIFYKILGDQGEIHQGSIKKNELRNVSDTVFDQLDNNNVETFQKLKTSILDVATKGEIIHKNWIFRRRIFRTMYLYKLNAQLRKLERLSSSDPTLGFLSDAGNVDHIPAIFKGLNADLLDLACQYDIVSWADLLKYLISETYPKDAAYANKLIDRFCQYISGEVEEDYSIHGKFNLALILLDTLHSIKIAGLQNKSDIEEIEGKMAQVLRVFTESFLQKESHEEMKKEAIEKLGLLNYGFHCLRVVEGSSHYIEAIYLRTAAFLFVKKQNADFARILVYHVVCNSDFYDHITREDRLNMINILGSLVDKVLYSKDPGHRDMVHKTVFVFFKNIQPSELELASCKEAFAAMCRAAGAYDNRASGLQALIQGINADEELPTEGKEAVIQSMRQVAPSNDVTLNYSSRLDFSASSDSDSEDDDDNAYNRTLEL